MKKKFIVLLVISILSFVPVLGFFMGFGAIIGALKIKSNQKIVSVLVLAVIGILFNSFLLGLGIKYYNNYIKQVSITREFSYVIEGNDLGLKVNDVSFNYEELTIEGSNNTIKKIDKVLVIVNILKLDVGTYDIDDLDIVFYDQNNNELEDIKVLDNDLQATVEIDSYDNIVVRDIEITTINSKNLSEGYIANIIDAELTLTLRGPLELIEQLDEEDIECFVDLDGLLEGEYSVLVNVNIPDMRIEVLNQPTVMVRLVRL